MNPPIPSFSATVAAVDGNVIVELLGEVDMDSAPDLASALEELTEGGPPEIILDFSNLDFLDSSGIAVLVAAQQRLILRGRHLSVRYPNAVVTKVFEVTDLLEYLHVGTSDSVE
jgi:anti-sigma B factor antagonist